MFRRTNSGGGRAAPVICSGLPRMIVAMRSLNSSTVSTRDCSFIGLLLLSFVNAQLVAVWVKDDGSPAAGRVERIKRELHVMLRKMLYGSLEIIQGSVLFTRFSGGTKFLHLTLTPVAINSIEIPSIISGRVAQFMARFARLIFIQTDPLSRLFSSFSIVPHRRLVVGLELLTRSNGS